MSQQNDNNQQKENQPKNGRAQLKHVLLDVTFKDKSKIVDLEIDHGPLARLLLMDILATCSSATDALISRQVCAHLARRVGIDTEKTEQILNYCISKDILWSIDGKITNSRVIKDQESYFNKLERDRIRKDSGRIPRGKRADSDLDIDIDYDLKDLKKNGISLVGEFDHPEIWKWLHAWAAKLWQNHKRKLDQIGVEALCSTFKSRENLRSALRYTCTLTSARNVVPAPERDKIPRPSEKPPPQSPGINPAGLSRVDSILKTAGLKS